jgi:tRNA (adenine57-N1/adenine58-N1)-methyltransferase
MKEIIHASSSQIKDGDLVQIIGDRNKQFIIKLSADGHSETHQGLIEHNDLIGKAWGSQIRTKAGKLFLLLQPSMDDLLREINRTTQIMYPKDIGYVILSLGIGSGTRVIEAGTGSGALTTALAYLVGPEGKVYSYELKPKHQAFAKRNLKDFGLDDRVKFKIRNINEGFDEKNVNAVFLDLQDPENYIAQVREALMPGGHFGCILPTTNQVSTLITELKRNKFAKIEVSEILHRYYKTSATRLRPADQMVGHTGFLVFARRTSPPQAVEE